MLRDSLQHSVHKLEVRWINSHSDRDVKEHGIGHDPDIPMHAYEGNKLADDLARKGADEHEVDAQAAQQQIELEQEAEEVLRRLVVLALEGCRELGNVPKRPIAVARPRVTLQQEIEVMERITRHKALRLSNTSLHCLVCFPRSSVEKRKQLEWLKMDCSSVAVQLYGTKPHFTHTLAQREVDGLIWCMKCGCWSGNKYRALASGCDEQPQSGLQQLALRRLSQGLNPPGIDLVEADLLPAARLATELFVEGLD